MQGGWCQVCGSSQRQELAWGGARPDGVRACFVLCQTCGHVYQDPLPDDEALCGYDSGAAPRSVESDLGSWLADLVEPLVPHRTLLAIGEGLAGVVEHRGLLAPFRERGWDICSVASTSSLLGRSSESAPDSRRPWPQRPNRTFSLILGGPIERLADPGPRLRFLRRHVDDAGFLFLAVPNLLEPCPAGRPVEKLFHSSSVRLYSPGTGRTLLARSGFRTEQVRAFQGDGVLGLVARPVDCEPDHPFDDPQALLELFRVLQWPGSTDRLGWNLASLAETQAWTLPPLCQRPERGSFAVRRSGRCLVALEGRRAGGEEDAIVTWGNLDGYQQERATLADWAEQEDTLIQLGLGSGELASHLAERLGPGRHLFVWEADPALARAIFELVDLSPLWLSGQVSLLLGPHPELPPALDRRLLSPALVYSTPSAKLWNPWAYRSILSRLTLSVPAGR